MVTVLIGNNPTFSRTLAKPRIIDRCPWKSCRGGGRAKPRPDTSKESRSEETKHSLQGLEIVTCFQMSESSQHKALLDSSRENLHKLCHFEISEVVPNRPDLRRLFNSFLADAFFNWKTFRLLLPETKHNECSFVLLPAPASNIFPFSRLIEHFNQCNILQTRFLFV